MKYEGGAHEVGDGVFAYLQPDGSWGWSNAGLVAGEGTSLLVDTLFDLRLTRRMLEELRPLGGRIDTVINTHANGDHCWGNELVDGAHIVASKACAEEMGGLSPDVLATMVREAPDMGRLGEYVARIFGPFDFEGITLARPTDTFEGTLTQRGKCTCGQTATQAWAALRHAQSLFTTTPNLPVATDLQPS